MCAAKVVTATECTSRGKKRKADDTDSQPQAPITKMFRSNNCPQIPKAELDEEVLNLLVRDNLSFYLLEFLMKTLKQGVSSILTSKRRTLLRKLEFNECVE